MPQRIASLTPLRDVLARIEALVKPVAAQRINDLTNALGHIAAEDVTAGPPLPMTAIALRDGWALPISRSTPAPMRLPLSRVLFV